MDLAGMKRRELQALCKRHGLPAGGSNADLVARLDAALSGAAGAEEEVARVPARKGCLKQIGRDAAEAKKVTFAAEEGKTRRLRSRVIWSPVVVKTRGKSAQAGTDSAAAEDSISAEVVTDVPVRQSRRNSFVVADVSVRRSRRNSLCAAEAEEAGEAVAIDRKHKRKHQENDEAVAIGAQVGVLSRVTRRSSLAGPAAVLPPVVEKKRGRGKAAGGGSKLAAEAQDSEPDVQSLAQVEVSARITRSRATAPAVMSPSVVVNKRRRKTGDERENLELPTVSDVPRNDASVTRSLRNRVVQVNNSTVDETHTARQLENKTQPSRPPTRRHQQVSSSVEDKNQEQTSAPNKAPLLRRSGRNHSEDVEKQLEVKEPIKRSTCKSVVLATLEKEENDLVEEKNPEAHGRRSMRKSIVPVKDINVIGEKIHNTNSEDVVKQPATKGPVRRSRRKSIVSELHEKEKGLIVEKNMEAHEGRSMRKPVMPVKDIKAAGEGTENAKGKGVEKQFVVKQPIRRSSRKSVLPDMLGNNSGLLAAQMNAEMNVRRSTRKSVLPNMLNEENQDHSKLARKENFQSVKCKDDERHQKVKEPIKRSIAAVPLEEPSNGLHEEKMSKNPMRRSTRKSVALNEVEKASMDHTEIVALELERVGEEGLKLRKHRRSSLEISSSANDSWKIEDFDGEKFKKQQNTPIPNEKDNTGGTQQASISTTLKGRSSKRRRTTASEEVRSVKEANDDIIIREPTKDAHKATHEYKESGSRVLEFGQVNATREEHSSGPVTVTLTEEIFTAQSVPVVIPGSESGDNGNESSDKSKQEHSDIQAINSHLSETSGELDQSSCIAGLVVHNVDVSEDKSLMSKDGLSIDLIVGDHEGQSPVSEEGRVGLEANASEPGKKNLANVMSIGLHAKSLQHGTDVIAEKTDKVAEESIRPADLEECPSRCSIGNPLSTSLHLEGAADDTSLPVPVLNADKGCSSDGRPSSFDLELMFAEGGKESYSRNAENTAVEMDGGNKPSTPVTPGFYVRSDCLEDEDVQPTECDADKKLDVDEGVAEEVLAQEKSNDQHDPAKTDLNMKLNDELAGPGTESGCSITEKNGRLVADILNQQAIIQVQQGDWQEGDLDKPSLCSATPERKHECDLTEETVLPSMNTASLPSAEQSPFGLESLFSQESIDKSVGYGALASATAHTENGFGDSKGCHVKSALENTHVSEPFSHYDTEGGISKNDDCVHTSQKDHIMAGLRKANLDEERVLSVFSLDAKHIEVINPEEVACEGECDADKKLDVDEGVEEEDFAKEKSNDQHVLAKTDLNMKLNGELAGSGTESGCSITEKNARLVADNLEEQATILSQQGDVKEGDLKKPSRCSTTPECKHKCGLPEETSLLLKNTRSLSSEEQSPFVLDSSFSQENIDESMNSVAAHTKNGFDDSKDCHVKSAIKNTHVSEHYSHDDTEEGISKNDDCTQTSQQDKGMEGLPEANLDEKRVMSVFSLDAKHIKEVINFEEVASEGERSKKFVHSEDFKASSEKTNVNGPDGNAYGITDAVLSSALYSPASDNYEICLGYNTDVLHQGQNDQCGDDTEDIIEDASAKDIERGIVLLSSKERSNLRDGELNPKLEGAKVVESGLYFNKDIGNIFDSGSVVCEITPSGSGVSKDSSKEYIQEVLDGFSMQTSLDGSSTCGEKIVCRVDAIENEGALSEEAAHTMKNYAGTCSSNPKELIMDLQSLFSKGNTKESDPHDGLALPSAENLGQWVKVHHSSDLSHLDEPIECSNTEVLRQGHNHKDRSIEDRVEQVASEPCRNDIVEAAATAKCIESGLVLPRSEERSHLNDDQLNPKLESPNIIASGLDCDKDVCITSDNGSIVVAVGERTPSGSALPEDYPKDHYPRQELLDGFSVESSLQGIIFEKTIVSGVAAIDNPSSSLATPDNKYEGALSEEAVCRMKNYTGTSSVDPRHLVMDLQSLFSEGSTEKSNLQDLSRHEEKESCVSVPMQVKENGGFLRSSHMKSSLTSVQIDLADDAHLNERDVVATVEVLCEEKVERKSMPTSDSDIVQEKSYSNEHGICHSRSQKQIIEANSRLFSCGTEVLHQGHKECNEPNEGKFGPKALVENNTTEDAPIEGIGSSLMVPLVAGMSERPDEQLNTKMSDESEVVPLPKDFCQKQVVPEVLSSPKSPEESAKFQCASLSGSGPCQQHGNESTSMQVTCNIETLNQDHEEYNQNNEDQTNSGISSSNVPEAVEIEQSEMEIGLIPAAEATVLPVPDEQLNNKLEGNEDQITPGTPASCVPEAVEIEQSEMEIGLIPAAAASVLPVPDEQLNNKLEGNGDQITPGFLASCVPEVVEIEQSEMEIGLIPAAEASVLPVPDEQLNNEREGNEDQVTPGIPASCVSEAVEIEQSEMEIGLISAAETSLLPVSDEQSNRELEDNEVDEHSCSYDNELLKREASNLSKDDCMDLSSEDNLPNDLPAPKSPEQSAFLQNDNDSGSVGIGQSSRQSGIAEIRAKLQSFKVSSMLKGSYIAMSAPRLKPGDSMSQSAIALLRNIENTTAAKAGHPVKPNADGKDSSRRALQPISGRPREH